MPEPENGTAARITAKRVYELYVEDLEGRSAAVDETLVTRLRWFETDLGVAIARIAGDPESVMSVMAGLSRQMQELDARAGESDALHSTLASARRWALLLPDSAVHA